MNSKLKEKNTSIFRKLHADDRKLLTLKARALVKVGRCRLEFKLPCYSDYAVVPEAWLVYDCPAIPIGVTPCDYDMEVLPPAASLPKEGEFWIDVQVCEFSYGEWEPADWFRADFKDGRLVKIIS